MAAPQVQAPLTSLSAGLWCVKAHQPSIPAFVPGFFWLQWSPPTQIGDIAYQPKATKFMGATLSVHHMTNSQLQAHIRRLAKDSSRVVFVPHAYERMLQRSVSDWEVLECLRYGVIERPPKQDIKTGSLRCRMEHFGASRNLAVVVALDDGDPDVIVVTVITKTR